MTNIKPLGFKAYGSIPHLPESRLGSGDHQCNPGHARIATRKTRDRHDQVIAQEKLDGSNVAIANIDGVIVPLVRSGYVATSSPYRQHHLFSNWVYGQTDRFLSLLNPGERLCGEWLAQAHGTRYALTHEPFVAFDLMVGQTRLPYAEFIARTGRIEIIPPTLLHNAPTAFSVQQAIRALAVSGHGAIDPVEGAVWRVERNGAVEFLVKYVHPNKTDGCYLSEVANQPEVWNINI